MALQGRDLALLSSRVGVARVGASRVGFCPDDVEGTGHDEPGEYRWKEEKIVDTTWTLGDECQGGICGWRPVAAFGASPSSGSAPLDVTFTDQSEPAHDITSWAWDFGDGTTSTDQNPAHTYAADGDYTVTLTVTSPKGSSSATGTVSVATTTATISGTVYGVDGVTPYVGATMTLDIGGTTTSGVGGTYTFTGVTPGAVTVLADAPGGLTGFNSGMAVAGVTLTLDINLVSP